MDKELLIAFILENDPKANKEKLQTLSLGALVMLKVQIELDQLKNGNVKQGK